VKVLITGATGFLGKAVARTLAARGHELRVLARARSRLDGLPAKVEIVRGDVLDAQSMKSAAQECAAVVHMAALVKMWRPDASEFDAVNVGGLRNALAAASAAGARLVYTSSFIAVGPTGKEPADESLSHPGDFYRNDYERTKAVADGLARRAAADGVDIVTVYPGVVYGPGELTDGNLVAKMVADHMAGRFPGFVGGGDRLWSYSYVDDVAEGHAFALEKGQAGERYFLSGVNATHLQLFDALRDVAGVPPPRRHIPYLAASSLGACLVMWAELTGHPPLLTPGVVNVFKEHWAYTSQKAERELGYRVTPLRDGLRRTVEWLRASGHVA
jgi:NAD+-dependent farnesol dehydrogenase